MSNLYIRLGKNIGKILLDISQQLIQEGNSVKAIKTYMDSMVGFKEEYVIKILTNEYVLITDKDGASVNLTDSEEAREANKKNMTDWYGWLTNRLLSMADTLKSLTNIRNEFYKTAHTSILDYDINNIPDGFYDDVDIEVRNLAAKLIAGDRYAGCEDEWQDLCDNVSYDTSDRYEKAVYLIVKYVDGIRMLHREYMVFINAYEFLIKNKIASRPKYTESYMENVLSRLFEFANTSIGYYHPLCNAKLSEYKKSIEDDVLSTEFGKELRENGIIKKNIMDNYDAGWLSPDGIFYGANGDTSSLIHLTIAEQIKGDMDGDRILEKEGWVKIHGNEVYGSFIGKMTPTDDFPYKFCPTDVQISIICKYIDMFHDGKMYTQSKIVKSTDPVYTYKVRQMDMMMLNKLFR